MVEEIEVNLAPAFLNTYQCIFIYECQDELKILEIWDAFLLDGDCALFKLIISMI